jgi:hypothetical protein
MVPGIEPYYQRIADAMLSAIPEDWTVAEYLALFYPDSSIYEGEYIRQTDGQAVGFQPGNDGARAIRELRKAFRQAEKPLWGQILFILRPDGSFNVLWGYAGCDSNGDLPFNEEAELRRHEARRLRLIAGTPRQSNYNPATGTPVL